MLRSLSSGVSGLQEFQQRLDVIGNNIANVNTNGFKEGRVDFADTFSQTLQGGGPTSMQVGTGVTTGSIRNQFTQGAISNTGVETNLAINGNGFFTVRDTVNGAIYATRDGAFKLDSDGYLVTANGLRVQGFSDAGLTTRGDIKIDTTGAPANADPNAKVKSLTIGQFGEINVELDDNIPFVRGQILMQNFQNPQALLKEGDNLYAGFSFAGPLAQIEAAGTNGLGNIESGALESSNVDLTVEFADLITSQRGFQANARIITTSDEVLQEVVNLKR
jgi:flagellar hook protein FlgE